MIYRPDLMRPLRAFPLLSLQQGHGSRTTVVRRAIAQILLIILAKRARFLYDFVSFSSLSRTMLPLRVGMGSQEDIQQYRKEIDRLDDEILRLLNERSKNVI